MDRTEKLFRLDTIYKVYDNYISEQQLACTKHCESCCTRNVTLTTLEGTGLVEYMKKSGKTGLFDDVKKNAKKNRFYPKTTTNRIAELCIHGEEIPDEEIDPAWGKCPLLKNTSCPVYNARPFSCRCLVSKTDCRETGYADIDPFTLTVNYIFFQYIEHLDHQGLTGNLTDVILFLESEKNQRQYTHGDLAPNSMIHNYPLTVLMIPPEHRKQAKSIQESLTGILS